MQLSRIADTALDRSVVLGYTKIGSRLRRRWWPDDPAPGALAGKHVIVTGATSGIGTAMARAFAKLGATVHVVGRNPDKVRATVGEIRGSGSLAGIVIDEVCDVSDLHAVLVWTDDLLTRVPELHGLVHNAGVMTADRAETPQGHEVQLATHVLGPHLMTELLLPALEAAGGASVVWMSSGGMYTAPLIIEDLEYRDGYNGTRAYARTKRMQVVLADAWAERLLGTDVSVESMHPGWADTPGVADALPVFRKLTGPLLRDAADAADTAVWLVATRPDSRPGHFWHDRQQRPTTFGWERGEDAVKVGAFLEQVCIMTDTPNEWATIPGSALG